ncbi:glycosyltransferase family 39 protein [Rhizobium sp. TRM95796]|uniref:glycosyltransferase family 39 protein n=1 Tax=Rhizobium sp. TRM95796 TaxID=2979862 RepID=UPI0021E7A1ED|nr:glycosyltransferase family 39 protein [Rhizobium sp. TRM95796]MCV3768375.1 glycosyltransferase family 39 protein [Rhizobium sp. TRM95796]
MLGWLEHRFSHLVLLIAGYFLVNAAVRLMLPASLELDEAQQMFFSQWLAAGYDSQPPLYNWLQYGVFALIGPSVLALTLTKNTLLFLTYLFYALTARRLLSNPLLIVVATLGLLTIPQIGFEAQRDLTHTVAVLFSSSLFIYALTRTVEKPDWIGYALTGVAIGCGALSKYNFVLMPVAALLVMLLDRDMRRRVLDIRLLITIVIALLIVTPHALWLKDNLGLATERTMGKMMAEAGEPWLSQVAEGLLSLVGAVIGFSAITLLLYAAAFRKSLWRAMDASSDWARFMEKLFAAFLLLIAALVLFAGAENIKDRWLTPLLFLLPLYLALKLDKSALLDRAGARRMVVIGLAIMALIPTALGLRIPILGALGDYEKLNVPYEAASAEILATSAQRQALIVTNDQQLAGNLRFNIRGAPVVMPGFTAFAASEVAAPTGPVLMVWRNRGKADPALPGELAAWRASQPVLAPLPFLPQQTSTPYIFGRAGDRYHIGYAWLTPVTP